MTGGLNSMFAGLALYLPEGVRNRLRRVGGERGQAFVEYVLLLTFIAVTVFLLATFTNLSTSLSDAITRIGTTISSA